MKMKLNKIFCFLTIGILAIACNESDDLVTKDAKEGGLLNASSLSLNYVVGNPEGPYEMEFKVNQGNEKIKTLRLYKSFTTTVKYTVLVGGKEVERDSTFVSNEVLDRTLTVTESNNHYVAPSYTFDELISGLSVASLDAGVEPLSNNDGDYQIGDKWVFRVEATMEDGSIVQQAAPVAISVSTRYAGKYKAISAEYYRLGVPTYTGADWPAVTQIESVDATTYRVVEYLGPAVFTGNTYYFQIINGVITYPDETPSGDAQTGNSQPFITCQSNPVDMSKVHCGESNIVINDDATGKDRLIMSFGYYTPGSGPRTFYQVLEKIVE